MTSDYVDNWDALPSAVQEALAPIIARFDEAADLLFDRRLNLSFEAAVKRPFHPRHCGAHRRLSCPA